MKAFTIDMGKCTGCYCCQLACKDEHVGNDWGSYSKAQPDTGQFWGKLNEYVRGQVPQVKMSFVFIPCQHCVDAPCVSDCPVDDACYTREDGLIVINPNKCTGCALCVTSCPYGVIYFNQDLNIAQKCTGCAHLVDAGVNYSPRCADACPHEAIKFGDESSLDRTGTETLYPEYGLTTRVYYKNLPKRFVAGTVYDPSTEEVVIGATCAISGVAGTFTTTTDKFGDFWINELAKGEFTLTITNGSKSKTINGNTITGDVGLGDIALQ
jgi:tetrathionate reductase subunit B